MKKNDLIKILATALYRAAEGKKGEQLKKIAENFWTYISRHHLEYLMPKVFATLGEIDFTYRQKIKIKITSRFSLGSAEKNKLLEYVEKKTGKKGEVDEAISEDIIGGVKVRYADRLLDMSVKKVIRDLKNQLVK